MVGRTRTAAVVEGSGKTIEHFLDECDRYEKERGRMIAPIVAEEEEEP